MATHRDSCDSVFRAKGRFEALDQPLPQGEASRRPKQGADVYDGQIWLHRRRERRGRHTGQPRVLVLHGRIDCARPLRIGDAFRGELAKEKVTAREVEAGGSAGRTPQSMSLGPPAVMITLPA